MDIINFSWNTIVFTIIDVVLKTVPLILSMFVGTWIVRVSFLPKVDIKTKKEHVLQDNGGCFLSLNIVNIGPNMAQKCCAYIILDTHIRNEDILNMNEISSDEHLPTYAEENNNFEIPRNTLITREKQRDVQQIQLCWTHHGNPYLKDLNPGVQAQVDICRYQRFPDDSNLYYIIFPTEKGWRRVHFRMKNQRLIGKLYLCPANSHPNVFKIDFCLGQDGRPKVTIKKKRLNYFSRKRLLLK